MTVDNVANKQLLASLLFLVVGLSWPDLNYPVKTAAAQGTSSDSAGYTAVVTFRVNATSSAIKNARGKMTVWNPTVSRTKDYSLGKVSIVRVDPTTKDVTASMESGYIVFPAKYGDNKTRFFVRWKNVDANGTRTGCFDLDCEGFVPTPAGRRYIGRQLGTSQSASSAIERMGRGINLIINREIFTGNWELTQDSLRIGYWPASLFSTGKGHFNAADYGGEVYDSTGNTSPTTQMGNGVYPRGVNLSGAYIKDITVSTGRILYSYVLFRDTTQVVTNPTCYGPNVFGIVSGITNEGTFYYGGPGCGQQQ